MASLQDPQVKLKDTVKQYEAKLAALNALNSALQKENEQLREELDEAVQPKTESELEALELKEEFARRLGEQQRTIEILKAWDSNQKLQAKVRGAAADSSATEAQLSVLQDKLAKQQADNTALTSKVGELESSSRKLHILIKELENERDMQASKALLADSGDAGASLMRQIQSLAAQTAAAQSNAAEQEALLLSRLRAAEQAGAAAADAEQEAVARATSAEAAVQAAREAAAAAVQECAALRSRLEAVQRQNRALEAERNGAQERLVSTQDQAGRLGSFSSGLQLLNATNRVNSKASRLSSMDSIGLGFPAWANGEGSFHHQQQGEHQQQLGRSASSGQGSPTASQGQLHHQMSGAFSGSLPLAASVETVQQLQRRVHQLQQEVAVAQRERDAAGEQLYQAVKAADVAAETAQKAEQLKQKHAELENKLHVAIEIIGERSLRIEELEADIMDMKAIFHAQLEAAATQLHALLQQQELQQQAADEFSDSGSGSDSTADGGSRQYGQAFAKDDVLDKGAAVIDRPSSDIGVDSLGDAADAVPSAAALDRLPLPGADRRLAAATRKLWEVAQQELATVSAKADIRQ
eukprot:gene7626-7828_t